MLSIQTFGRRGYVMIGFIVWTLKFVEFGDKTNDVMTKQKKGK